MHIIRNAAPCHMDQYNMQHLPAIPLFVTLGLSFSISRKRLALRDSVNSAPFSSKALWNAPSVACLSASAMMNSAGNGNAIIAKAPPAYGQTQY
jgi:hypothetical protein